MMLLLEKIQNSSITGYFYTPQNYAGPGIIEIVPDTGEVYILELSSFDKQDDSTFFANRARGLVKQLWDSGEFPDKNFYAWG
ncbi:hypothetical protein KMP11_02945 [Gemella sp. zg-570]|uniref:hypothetical protein n=1 Tax=Gemella sp. zg-570 TaxID=2840371 RepID=UPI001C0B20EF|nr:hypothetical protein [Gemella sp. zg-570]QWQ39298.1 hypothetical protein KMP11_02945 [Gemella sp. zg-570]